MSSLIEHVERAEIARWEAIVEQEPQCESIAHNDPGPWDRHGGPAAFWQTSDVCKHGTGLRCAPHVLNIRLQGGAYCDICDMDIPSSEIRFVEL